MNKDTMDLQQFPLKNKTHKNQTSINHNSFRKVINVINSDEN